MLLWLTAAALAGVVPPEAPELGVSTTIRVVDSANHPVPGVSVRVVYRPGSHSSHEVNAGLTDGSGALEWTPSAAGPVVIRAQEEEARVIVPVSEAPAEILLLLLASLAAAGGAAAFGLSPFTRGS